MCRYFNPIRQIARILPSPWLETGALLLLAVAAAYFG